MSSRGSGFCDRGDLSWTGTDCRAAAQLAMTGMVLVLGIGAEVGARTARLYGGWMRLASGAAPQPNLQFVKSKSWPGKACHREGAVFATAAI
ncbi:MAG: hypothetical protein ACYC6H_12980 [Bellilinea sp.]